MRTLIIGASGGIGAALLAKAGAGAIGLSRRDDGLEIADEASVAATLGRLEGGFDRVFIATGGLTLDGVGPEKSVRALDASAMARQFAVNAIGPALVLKHLWRLIPRDRACKVAVLSARVGSIGDNALGGWYSYRAAKAAVNQLVHTAAIELARSHSAAVLVALHPGTVATGMTAAYAGPGHPQTAPEDAAQMLISVLDGLTPAQTGGFFDWQAKPVVW